MKSFILFAAFVLGCHATCWDVERKEDHLSASCIDEDTQEPFLYKNYDIKPDNDTDTDVEYLADRIYQDYASLAFYYRGNQSVTDLAKRDDPQPQEYWSICGKKISGRCLNTGFNGVIAIGTLAVGIAGVVYTYDHHTQINQKPKTICTTRNKQQICVGWAVKEYFKLTQDEADAIGKQCAENCAQQNQNCDFALVGGNEAQYQCVTSAAEVCRVPSRLRLCDN